MTIADNKAVSRKVFEKVWNEGKTDLIPELYSPDFKITDPNNPVTTKGTEAAKTYHTTYKKAFPDLSFRIDNQVAEGDLVVNILTATGTHNGEFLGIAPTHKKATANAIVTMRIVNGKVLETTTMWDALAFLRATGVELPLEAAMSHR